MHVSAFEKIHTLMSIRCVLLILFTSIAIVLQHLFTNVVLLQRFTAHNDEYQCCAVFTVLILLMQPNHLWVRFLLHGYVYVQVICWCSYMGGGLIQHCHNVQFGGLWMDRYINGVNLKEFQCITIHWTVFFHITQHWSIYAFVKNYVFSKIIFKIGP